jgi:hypothetical protein
MSFCKIWTKCDLDDYEAGSFVKNDLNNSNNFWCGKNYINTKPQTNLRTNFILMTINFIYKYRKVISSRLKLNVVHPSSGFRLVFLWHLSTIQCTGDVLLLSTPMQEIRNTDFRSSFLLKSALYC